MNEATALAILRHQWRIVVGSVLLSVAGAGVFVTLTDQVYEARADVLVSPVLRDRAIPGTGVIVESTEPIRSIQTATALINTETAAENTAQQMGIEWTTQRVIESVVVTPRGQSNVVSIAAKATDSEQAAQLANTFATEAVALRDKDVRDRAAKLLVERSDQNTDSASASNGQAEIAELKLLISQGDPSLSVINIAPVPRHPSSPGVALIFVLAAAAGVTIGCAAGLALERARPKIAPSKRSSAKDSPSSREVDVTVSNGWRPEFTSKSRNPVK